MLVRHFNFLKRGGKIEPSAQNKTGRLRVSIAICTYTEERLADVYQAVDSARSQTYPADEILLVVDNNEGLYQKLVKNFGQEIRVILSNKGFGVSVARNVGIQAAKGGIIAFLDDDTTVNPDWLERLLPHYQDENVVGVGGQTVLAWASGKPPIWFPWELDWILGGTAHKQLVVDGQEVYTLSDPNMSFRREALLSAGLWRVGLGQQMRAGRKVRGGDIAEVCHRIRLAYPQGRFIYDPSAIMYHKLPAPRTRLIYYLKCAFLEGNTRAMVDQITQIRGTGKHTFPSHQIYLRNLIRKRLPMRLTQSYRPSYGAQLMVMLLTLVLMASGYIRERISEVITFNSNKEK